ncbi:site-specific integrase [Salmonella enterica]|nr:site-specific integrase [Salmonella enterica]ECG8521643.1 tyrosine-type recombinase/integrase [Salmonella enterica subsp. diarizonae]EDJ1091591.1 site-specific integrase [Salmonella enterica]EGP4106380.1 site-specific integrase [Salmonella enterica]EGU7234467.1 site-specific integrase [Salmonella enterica]
MNRDLIENKFYKLQNKPNGFNLHDPVWVLDKNTKIYVGRVLNILDEQLVNGFLNTLAIYACEYSGGYVKGLIKFMKNFIRVMNPTYINDLVIMNYKNHLLENNKEYYLAGIKAFLMKWYSLGHYGVDKTGVVLLNDMKFTHPKQGKAILNESPDKGPLTKTEHENFNNAMVKCFNNKRLSLSDFAACMLISLLGRRPMQIALLKYKHLRTITTTEGELKNSIFMPRIKQRNGSQQGVRELALNFEMAEIIYKQANYSLEVIESKFGGVLEKELRDSIPVFLDEIQLNNLKNKIEVVKAIQSGDLHNKPSFVAKAMKKIVSYENVLSNITGELLNVTPIRFRYSLGTHLAQDGHDLKIIAELLDHNTPAISGGYIKNLSDNVGNIDKAVSEQLSFIASLFMGQTVNKIKNPSMDSCSSQYDISLCANSKYPCINCHLFSEY